MNIDKLEETLLRRGSEKEADFVKTVILKRLVKDGLLGEEEADTWCASHTIILRKKSLFRTISSAWDKKEEIVDGYYYIVVHNSTTPHMVKDSEK